MTDLRSLTVRDAARQIAESRLTAEALTAVYLDRIEAREAVVGAWQYLDRERALATARQRGLINDAEADQLKAVQLAIAAVVAVDDFPAEEIARRPVRAQGDVSSPTTTPFQSSAAE